MKKKKREKVRQQQRPSITGNNHITAEDRNLLKLPESNLITKSVLELLYNFVIQF